MPASNPLLRIQTASLYASGDASTFTGTGGPYGFSPFTGQFGGIISSAGLASEPFSDTVYSVAAQDEVLFVIAVQNMAADSTAYGVTVQTAMPTGFAVPPEGPGLTVTDGTGTDLAFTGDPFTGAGLQIGAPIGGYDANSGLNVALVTFTLKAGQGLPGPNVDVGVSSSLTSYSATSGGANLAPSNPASARTDVVSAAPTPVVTAETDPTAVAKGQTIAFDVTLALPAGTLPNLKLSPVLPSGASMLDLVSSSVVSTGAGLTLGTPVVGSDGTISFGTVTSSATATPADDTITARIVVRADGTASGQAILETVLSTTDSGGGVWSVAVDSGVGVVVPPPPPMIGGLTSGQTVTTVTALDPFAQVVFTPVGQATSGTVVIALGWAYLGTLFTHGPGTIGSSGTTFTYSGAFSDLQAAVRQLAFSGAMTGTETFTITLVDSAGGIAQDTSSAVTVTPPPSSDPLFDPAYYLANNPDVAAAGVDPLVHYLIFGWKEGRNPDAFFDTRYYLAANPDVAASGLDPMLQYEMYGWMEGRSPSLAFSTSAYLQVNPDVQAAHVDPLVHYFQFGEREGRNAIPVGFDGNLGAADPLVSAGYFDPQLGASIIPAGTVGQAQAAELYNSIGWKQGLNPDAWFDSNYYLTHNPDVRANGANPLLHYEYYGWKEGRDPSLLFSTSQYLAAHPDVQASGVDPLLQFVTSGQAGGATAPLAGGTAPADPLVNAAYYDPQLGATLIPTGTAAAQQAAWSFDATGWQQRLNPDAWFDTNYYLSRYPDVAASGGDPLHHYEWYGWQEGRDPSAQFSTNKYLAAYPDVKAANTDPLLHYIVFGISEGRTAFAV